MQKQFEPAEDGWGFWLWWVLATTVGLAVGVGVGVGSIMVTVGAVAEVGAEAGAVFGAAVGAVVGTLQWLVLRGEISQAGWWVLASTVGFAVVLGAALATGNDLAIILLWPAVGAVVGTLQWLVLRGKISQAGWWVLASTLGWVVSGIVGVIVGRGVLMRGDSLVGVAIVLVVIGAVVGGITGGTLVWLLQHPIPDEARAIEVE